MLREDRVRREDRLGAFGDRQGPCVGRPRGLAGPTTAGIRLASANSIDVYRHSSSEDKQRQQPGFYERPRSVRGRIVNRISNCICPKGHGCIQCLVERQQRDYPGER